MGNNCSFQSSDTGLEIDETKINKKYFHIFNAIGTGGYGKVWKIESKITKEIFALKEMSKVKIYLKNSIDSISHEKKFLSQHRHAFIVNMYYAFQDREYLYIVMDYLSGGDLRYHIVHKKMFQENQAKFFISCLLLALEYLHLKGIIHRDIKPENLVFDELGYLHLTDFGLARTWQPGLSIIDTSGTPGYMAPETILNQPHGPPSDYYAVGVITYELMFGKRPFLGKSREEIKEQMLSKEIDIKPTDIPPHWSYEAADFINKLLDRKNNQRLGTNGINDIKEHPWLKDVQWEEISKKKIKSPFIPSTGNKVDSRYSSSKDKLLHNEYEYYLHKVNADGYFKNYYYNYFDAQCKEAEIQARKYILPRYNSCFERIHEEIRGKTICQLKAPPRKNTFGYTLFNTPRSELKSQVSLPDNNIINSPEIKYQLQADSDDKKTSENL